MYLVTYTGQIIKLISFWGKGIHPCRQTIPKAGFGGK